MHAVSNTARVKEMSLSGASLLIFAMLMLLPTEPLFAQYWADCRTGSETELAANVAKHHDHMFRMEHKLENDWYLQDLLPSTFEEFRLDNLKAILNMQSAAEASFAALFYAYSQHSERLCIWLIGDKGKLESARVYLSADEFNSIRPRLLDALGAIPPGPVRSRLEIKRITDHLLPPSIVSAIEKWQLARLLVVPIFDLGEIPYAALVLPDGRLLMDVVKITILPGFYMLREQARTPRGRAEDSLIAAYEGGSRSDPCSGPVLKYALSSAEEVRKLLGVRGPMASRRDEAMAWLRSRREPRFIFIAAHGISNPDDPVDGGCVGLEDGPWTGREVAKIRASGGLQGNPIVILSACESGIGKMFEVGSIGLSRAWYHAGASTVVASLWRVDEYRTMKLMKLFVENAKAMPPDQALWEAMKAIRAKDDPDPFYWAAFSVFGGFAVR